MPAFVTADWHERSCAPLQPLDERCVSALLLIPALSIIRQVR